jgi:hypothetical protein
MATTDLTLLDSARSTDGDDTEGSLCEFLAHSGDEEPAVPGEDNAELDFPYNREVLDAHMVERDGPRRSLRSRCSPVRYQDAAFQRLMTDDASSISDDESSVADPNDADWEGGGGSEESDDMDTSCSQEAALDTDATTAAPATAATATTAPATTTATTTTPNAATEAG